MTAELASQTFNQVMDSHSIKLKTKHLDFTVGDKCITLVLNQQEEDFSDKLFDLIFPRLKSGDYYHYMTFEAFKAVVKSKKLRFFSTKKLSSIGEFIPLCEDLNLDGYYREDAKSQPIGEHKTLMDNIFYKSFVSCQHTNEKKLWDVFSDEGRGVRLKIQIIPHFKYVDFRLVSYQGSKMVEVLNDLLRAFQAIDYNFIPFGISRMPAYYQLKEYEYQNECRLIAKRNPKGCDCFPFEVKYDEDQKCNYIDCSIGKPDCDQFQLKFVAVEPGPNCHHDVNSLVSSLNKSISE